MCAKVRCSLSDAEAQAIFEALGLRIEERLPEGDRRPTQLLPTVRVEQGRPVFEQLRWGLVPSWASELAFGRKTFNARAETVAAKPSFRDSFRARRCVVAVTGFYEWAEIGEARVPHRVTVPGGRLFFLAGLWASWRPPAGEAIRSCTIITTAANDAMRPLHDRMPVILEAQACTSWLDPATPAAALQVRLAPFAGALEIAPLAA